MRAETEAWLTSAESDAGAARALAESGYYSQSVFFTHLWVEKVLKAVIAERLGPESIRTIHNLSVLFGMLDSQAPEWFNSFLVRLTPHSVGARYMPAMPDPPIRYSQELCDEFANEAKRVVEWLRQQLDENN